MHILKFPKVYKCSRHVNQSTWISKIVWWTWFSRLNVVIEYAFMNKIFFLNSQRYIYVLDMSIKAHEFLENSLIDLICVLTKCGYSVCILIFWNSQRYIHILDMPIKAHEFENILIDLICATKCGYWVCIFWNSQGINMF